MNLYEINGAVAQLAEMLESGEIDETVYNDTIESLGAEIAVEDVVKAIRNKQAEAEAIKAEADKLTDKRRRAEAAAEGLKNILLTYLTATQQKKVSAGVFAISSVIVSVQPCSCNSGFTASRISSQLLYLYFPKLLYCPFGAFSVDCIAPSFFKTSFIPHLT